MTINSNDVLNAFLGSIRLNMKILREAYQVQSLEISPEKSSLLYLENDSGTAFNLHLPSDAVIGATTLINKSWDASRLTFIEQTTKESKTSLCLVDVGANVGLFTRQCLHIQKNIKNAYVYEPHPGNFDLLQRNLREIKKIHFNNAGLGPSNATMAFYLDPNNAGNYSLNSHAMSEEYATISVDILQANSEKDKWLQTNEPIIYKSDTQGFDESIATSYDLAFWDHVRCGCMELWKIEGKKYDKDKFMHIMEKFTHKVFADKPTQPLTSSALAEYLNGADRHSEDVLFWKE
jgi:FkbM family methyltransferase